MEMLSDVPIHLTFMADSSGVTQLKTNIEVHASSGSAPMDTELLPCRRLLKFLYSREDAGSDPAHFYRVTPVQPVAELRERALKLSPPAEPGPFRKPDLVELNHTRPGDSSRYSLRQREQFFEHAGIHGGSRVYAAACGGGAGSRAAQVEAAWLRPADT